MVKFNKKVALVNLPFGPIVPNLGLALISSILKQKGIETRVFYFNLDFITQLKPINQRNQQYHGMSSHDYYPISESIFSGVLFPGYSETQEKLLSEYLQNMFKGSGHEEKSQHQIEFFMSYRAKADSLINKWVQSLADFGIIGISTTFFQTTPALALAKRLKAEFPEKIIMLGGASCYDEMGQKLFQQFNFLDYVFSGEVEHVIGNIVSDVLQNVRFHQVEGVKLIRDGNRAYVEVLEPVKELNNLPLPDYTDYMLAIDRNQIDVVDNIALAIETSRGCWWGKRNQCTFCGLNSQNKYMDYRSKSWKQFKKEVEEFHSQYSIRHFAMTDNIMKFKLLKEMKNWKFREKNNIQFFYEIRPVANRNLVSELYQSGITMVQPGIEHFSTAILLLMNKKIRMIDSIAFLKYASDYGVRVVYHHLYGFPSENPLEYYNIIDMMKNISHLQPPTGAAPIIYNRFSAYHNHPEKFNIDLVASPKLMMIYPFSQEELSQLAYIFDNRIKVETPYKEMLHAEIHYWKENYSKKLNTLTWDSQEGKVVIEDSRRKFKRKKYVLSGFAKTLFYLLDKPSTLDELMNKVSGDMSGFIENHENHFKALKNETIYPSKQETSVDDLENSKGDFIQSFIKHISKPEDVEVDYFEFDQRGFSVKGKDILENWVNIGVVLQENDTYLSLPLFMGRRKFRNNWINVNI